MSSLFSERESNFHSLATGAKAPAPSLAFIDEEDACCEDTDALIPDPEQDEPSTARSGGVNLLTASNTVPPIEGTTKVAAGAGALTPEQRQQKTSGLKTVYWPWISFVGSLVIISVILLASLFA